MLKYISHLVYLLVGNGNIFSWLLVATDNLEKPYHETINKWKAFSISTETSFCVIRLMKFNFGSYGFNYFAYDCVEMLCNIPRTSALR